jgi:hypothetical protein
VSEAGRPPRPVGLSLMVLMCLALYVALPLLGVLYPVLLARWVRPAGGESGAELGGWGVLQVIFSLVFSVALALAWLGRPPRIRWVVAGLALTQAALVVVNGLVVLSQPPGWDSMADLQRDAQAVLIPGAVGLGLFVSWYVNRAPAVAFFAGQPTVYIHDEGDAVDGNGAV